MTKKYLNLICLFFIPISLFFGAKIITQIDIDEQVYMSRNEQEVSLATRLKKLENNLGNESKALLERGYVSFNDFIKLKSEYEEGHDGSGYNSWLFGSQMSHKEEYFLILDHIKEGFMPSMSYTFEEMDLKLNKTYQKVIKKLEEDPSRDYGLNGYSAENARSIQRSWISYRDANSQLLNFISPSVSESAWKSWLTKIRESQLSQTLNNLNYSLNFDFIYCPHCGKKLGGDKIEHCNHCSKNLNVRIYDFCPYCSEKLLQDNYEQCAYCSKSIRSYKAS